jgi:hypothetical protein
VVGGWLIALGARSILHPLQFRQPREVWIA